MDNNIRYNNNKFFDHNTPFSFSPFLEEGNFDEFRKTELYKDNYNEWINKKAIKMIVKQEGKINIQ